MASSGSISIQRTYSGAAGTLLLAQKKYHDAAAELEQDFMNPVSIRLLITAEQKANAKAAAEEWRVKLLDWKIPTVEEALDGIRISARNKRPSRRKNKAGRVAYPAFKFRSVKRPASDATSVQNTLEQKPLNQLTSRSTVEAKPRILSKLFTAAICVSGKPGLSIVV